MVQGPGKAGGDSRCRFVVQLISAHTRYFWQYGLSGENCGTIKGEMNAQVTSSPKIM